MSVLRPRCWQTTTVLGLLGLWLVGQALRDETWVTGLLFYIPSPIVALVSLIFGGLLWRRRRAAALTVLAGGLAPLAIVLFLENSFLRKASVSNSPDTVRLVHWNVFRGAGGWQEILAELRELRADAYVFSEVPDRISADDLTAAFGDNYSTVKFGNLAVVGRGTLSDGTWLHREDGVRVFGVVWQCGQGPCRLLVGDLPSNLLMARDPHLREVCRLMEEWRADLVVGDFNAPRQSRALSPLPAGFAHAYDVAGCGWSYTWPMPCPVYAIDQCIVGRRLETVSYEIQSSWRSDHRRQVVDFAFREM